MYMPRSPNRRKLKAVSKRPTRMEEASCRGPCAGVQISVPTSKLAPPLYSGGCRCALVVCLCDQFANKQYGCQRVWLWISEDLAQADY